MRLIDANACTAELRTKLSKLKHGEETLYSYLAWFVNYLDKQPTANQWIPVTERLPENEQIVLLTVEGRKWSGKPYRRVCKAFYTDGKHEMPDSAYTWDDLLDYYLEEYEKGPNGEPIIPEGWWEDVDYCDEFSAVDDFAVAWMPLPEPYGGDS